MDSTERRGSMAGPIAVGAILSLGLTILRVYGERHGWSPRFFNREAGGPGSIVGIVWLAPIFGIWFSMRLGDLGRGPASKGRALLSSFLGTVVLFGGFAVVGNPNLALPPFGRISIVNICAIVGGALAYSGWRDLGRSLLAYGYLARLPVVVVMYLAMQGHWGTHYELGMPGLPVMDFLVTWIVISVLPQLVMWIGFTIAVGSLFGALAALPRASKNSAATAAA